jgi:GGDEF domain-containing protein
LVEALGSHARDGDVIARIGPRRFAILLVECSAADALAISDGMRETLRARFDPALELRLGVVNAGPGNPVGALQLLERAQRHMEPVGSGHGASGDTGVGAFPGPDARVTR